MKLSLNDLVPCKRCGGRDFEFDYSTVPRGDGSIYRHFASIACTNADCVAVHHFAVGQHRSQPKAEQLAMQDWQERNEVES